MLQPTCHDIMTSLEKWAPKDLAEPWDNVGLQIGDPSLPVKSVLLSLDVDVSLLKHLQATHYDLVVSHHPLFFKPIRSIYFNDDLGQSLSVFLKNNTQLYTMHTNLDVAKGGVNDCLIDAFGLDPNKGALIQGNFGKWFQLESPTSLSALSSVMTCAVRGHQKERPIHKVGFLGGSGHGLLKSVARLGIDCFITGEITYHDHVYCEFNRLTTLALGHKESEVLVLPKICQVLLSEFPSLNVTTIKGDCLCH